MLQEVKEWRRRRIAAEGREGVEYEEIHVTRNSRTPVDGRVAYGKEPARAVSTVNLWQKGNAQSYASPNGKKMNSKE